MSCVQNPELPNPETVVHVQDLVSIENPDSKHSIFASLFQNHYPPGFSRKVPKPFSHNNMFFLFLFFWVFDYWTELFCVSITKTAGGGGDSHVLASVCDLWSSRIERQRRTESLTAWSLRGWRPHRDGNDLRCRTHFWRPYEPGCHLSFCCNSTLSMETGPTLYNSFISYLIQYPNHFLFFLII